MLLVKNETFKSERFFNSVTMKRKSFRTISIKVDSPTHSKKMWGFCAHGLRRLRLELTKCVELSITVTYHLKNTYVPYQDNASF